MEAVLDWDSPTIIRVMDTDTEITGDMTHISGVIIPGVMILTITIAGTHL